MKKSNMNTKTILAVLMAAALMTGACGCARKVAANNDEKKETTSASTTEPEESETKKAADLQGNPDREHASEHGVMRSMEVKDPVIEDLRSAYSVINWELYSRIVSGSEFTVETTISGKYDENAPSEVTVYVFAYNEDYAWDIEDAYTQMKGGECRPIADQEYNTIHTYWIQGKLPEDMPSGKYTMVFVLPDGTVDSMADFDLVQPGQAPAPVSID